MDEDEVPLESIIEASLQRYIVAPLHHHIYSYLLQHFGRGGDLRRLSENMRVLMRASPEEIGMDAKVGTGGWGGKAPPPSPIPLSLAEPANVSASHPPYLFFPHLRASKVSRT
jgi:hypothetical protein